MTAKKKKTVRTKAKKVVRQMTTTRVHEHLKRMRKEVRAKSKFSDEAAEAVAVGKWLLEQAQDRAYWAKRYDSAVEANAKITDKANEVKRIAQSTRESYIILERRHDQVAQRGYFSRLFRALLGTEY